MSPRPISPILGVPVDILGEIFTHACSPQPEPGISPIIDQSDPPAPIFDITPLVLAQVCRHWRNVVLQMAILWSTISVYSPTKRHVHLVQLWLARSGERCPLILTLHQAEHYPFNSAISDLVASEASWTRRILHMFIKCVHRWKKVDFSFSDGLPYRSLADLPLGSAPNLEVAIFDLQYWSKRSISKLWSSVNSSPALRQVSWVDLPTPPPSTPWAQLSHITVHGMTFDAVLSMLPSCASLQTLHAANLTNYSPSLLASQHSPITLPFLKTLSIASNSFDTGVFLDLIKTPSLDRFVVHHWMPRGTPIDTAALHRLLSRSGCTLKSLDVYSGELSEKDLAAYLSSPHLNEISKFLLDRRKLDGFIRHLTSHPSPPHSSKPSFDNSSESCDMNCFPWKSIPTSSAPSTILFPILSDLTLLGYSPADGLIGEMAASRVRPCPAATVMTIPITRPTTLTVVDDPTQGKSDRSEPSRQNQQEQARQRRKLDFLEVSLEALTHSHVRDRLMLTQLANLGLKVEWTVS
ncbi:hypothetical protein AX16_007294 [Volvariella volvacea WC 439]|nr:hypothetical protein AX16_007294 [Volvariella volvacea WC 439]